MSFALLSRYKIFLIAVNIVTVLRLSCEAFDIVRF